MNDIIEFKIEENIKNINNANYLFLAIFNCICATAGLIFLIVCFFSENFLIGFNNFLIVFIAFVVLLPIAFIEASNFMLRRKNNYQKMIFNNTDKILQLITFQNETSLIPYDEINIIQAYIKEVLRGYMEITFLIKLKNGSLLDITFPTSSAIDQQGLMWKWEVRPKLYEKINKIALNIVLK